MKCHVEQKDGSFVIEDREPECREDFCEDCGDCFACYGSEGYCGGDKNKKHRWIISLEES